jgi:ketosteroid isomerase-like protein
MREATVGADPAGRRRLAGGGAIRVQEAVESMGDSSVSGSPVLDGKVVRFQEYFDTWVAAEAFRAE